MNQKFKRSWKLKKSMNQKKEDSDSDSESSVSVELMPELQDTMFVSRPYMEVVVK